MDMHFCTYIYNNKKLFFKNIELETAFLLKNINGVICSVILERQMSL